MALFTTLIETPVGSLHGYASASGIRAVLWADLDPQRHGAGETALRADDHPTLMKLRTQLDAYFRGRCKRFEMPLDPVGTPFQQEAWAALRRIPHGATRTYAEQAAALGRPRAARAVGAANGRNPIAIVVPCHRVLGSNGALTGFAGGLAAKRFLLDLEQSHGH